MNDGSAVLLISGGELPYGISWGGYNNDSLAAGVYTYTVIDAIGCVFTDSVLITEPNQMISGLNYSNINNCITDNGYIDLNPSGGPEVIILAGVMEQQVKIYKIFLQVYIL